ncbi:hypothetical protein [Mastigocladopsis repens]|uniref:hypothetical protein n=1 Tax=Mastigocladopsis repens TaxID=221287 RepID=UPI0002D9E8DF|nr:hypothetical protein [Mastigocladopsis repens]
MFVLLSRVLLWLLVGTIIYSLFQRFYPSGTFVGRLILVILLLVILLSFINPNEPAVASLWRVVSFPLKPLGASILLMIFAAQRMKGGGALDAPGGYLIGWALTILLLASTPAVAYFLVRSPVAMVGEPPIASLESVQNLRSTIPTSETLVALEPDTTVTSDGIIYASRISDIRTTPYLLQTPQDIRTRGLRLEDFVPNADTLQITTRVWETYLNQIYFFLRGR